MWNYPSRLLHLSLLLLFFFFWCLLLLLLDRTVFLVDDTAFFCFEAIVRDNLQLTY